MNTKYRKYSKDVPGYLRNRPGDLVKHCLQKINVANGADLSAISIVNHGIFSVKRFTDNETRVEL